MDHARSNRVPESQRLHGQPGRWLPFIERLVREGKYLLWHLDEAVRA